MSMDSSIPIGLRRKTLARYVSTISSLAMFLGICQLASNAQVQRPFYTSAELAHAVAVQTANQHALLSSDGVRGVGVGATNGTLAITIFVDSTNRAAELPTSLDDLPVDLRVAGAFQAYSCAGSNSRVAYPLPVPIGVSGGNSLFCYTGTIGFKVRDNLSGGVGWISNAHVVSPGTDTCPGTAPIGTREYQPGVLDTACSPDQLVGTLDRAVPINFLGGNNVVDCGFVQSSDSQISGTILNLGPQVNNVVPVFVGQTVRKNGRTTSCTEGTVTAINVTTPVSYDTCGTAIFTNQITVTPNTPSPAFAMPGDSGSPIVDVNNNAVGLLFAGDPTTGIAFGNPISAVLNALNVSLSTATSSQVITRTSRYWFTHGYSSDTNCATLLKALTVNGGIMDLGFVTLATQNRNSDNVIDGTDAFIEALGFYYKSAGRTGEPNGSQGAGLSSSSLCSARKKLAVEFIAAIVNSTLLATWPPNATYNNGGTVTNFPPDLISQARAVGAGFDVNAIKSMTALLKKFNGSGLTNNLPNGLVECSAQPSKVLKPIARDPMMQDTCPGVNDTCVAAKTIFFSGPNPIFKDSVSLVSFVKSMPSPACNAGGRNAVWAVSPPLAANGRQFSVSTSGSNFDTVLAVWSGTCSNLVAVGCADGSLGPGGETLTFTADGTNTFYIVVEGKNGAYGKVKMSVNSF